jgi:glutamate-1-semialdehyde 2,1-aminomutase
MKSFYHKLSTNNHKLFSQAKKYIPGGVNSPVRSFKAVGGWPVFMKRACGSKIYGECDKEFIDYCLSWGALILGHTHPEVTATLQQAVKNGTSFGAATGLETKLAKLIVEAVPSVERVRLTSSGTEAVMSAVRLARAFTGKKKIIKFAGSYHGHADYLLVKAGSGAATLGIPATAGVPEDFTKHTIVVPYNNIRKLEAAAKKYQKDLAAIIVEPVAANCGVILPGKQFLPGLRKIADRYKVVLIFDEVITGFRLAGGGAQGYFGVKPDLTCLGKIIGAGLPVGAFGGRQDIMRLLAPEGEVYQAGTLSGNPLAVSAGITALTVLKETSPYAALEQKTRRLCAGIKLAAERNGRNLKINQLGSLFSVFFTAKDVVDFASARTQNVNLFRNFYHELLKEGIYFSPSGFEANFLSTAHSDEDIGRTLSAINKALKHSGRQEK